MLAEIWTRCNTMEECYEFMLAYAAQGLPSDTGSRSGGQVRAFLQRAVTGLTGLPASCRPAGHHAGLRPAVRYQAFFPVFDRDAYDALAALKLVYAHPTLILHSVANPY